MNLEPRAINGVHDGQRVSIPIRDLMNLEPCSVMPSGRIFSVSIPIRDLMNLEQNHLLSHLVPLLSFNPY